MARSFEILDRRDTPMGTLQLRRRREPILQVDVWEAILGEEHLMSTVFTAAEIALAELTLAAVEEDGPLDVVVGGLGLGYTARAALAEARVGTVRVVEALDAVIEWHERGLLPVSAELTGDDRCRLVLGDFFAMVAGGAPFGGGGEGPFDAVLLDIDHTPRHHLAAAHAPFYEPDGLAELARRLRPGGAFGLWSDDPPDEVFLRNAASVFADVVAHQVEFPNHHTGGLAANTVYVATGPGG